jgi:succinate dehydrogenase hydrophobic anchor subunit
MTLRNGSWTNRTDPMYDHSHEYRSSTVPRRYVNGTTIFCAIILVVWGIVIIFKH